MPARDPDRLPGPRDEQGWLAVCFVLATVVAVLDAATSLILMGLLIVPPLLAALRAGTIGTALVAAYCVALGIDSGVWNEFFFSADHLIRLLVIIVGSGLAVWIANLRHQNAAAQRAALVLGQTGALVEDALEERAVTDRVVKFAVPELASLCVIDIVSSAGAIEPVAIAADDPRTAKLFRDMRKKHPLDPGRDHPIVEALKAEQTLVLPDVPESLLQRIALEEEDLAAIRRLGLRSALIAPLRVGGETIGSMELISTMPDRYGPGEVALAEELARRAAIGIHNARLHERDARIARTLQQSLLPARLPQMPGFDVAARFRPQGTAVGGDFYDVFEANEGVWAAAIGDVCGKGPEAAALTSLTRYTLRAAALHRDSPCETLGVLNSALIAEPKNDEGRFCTAVYAKFDGWTASGVRLTACSGGHPHPLVLRANGDVETITLPGTLLGVFEEPRLDDTSTSLSAGDALVLYTDGVIELRGRNGSAPLLAIEDVVAQCTGDSAAKIAQHIEQSAVAAHGGAPDDDMAVLVLRYTG